MRGHSLPGRVRPLTSSSLRHLQSLRVHPIPQDGRVSGGRYLKVVGRTSAALTNASESSSIRDRHSKSADRGRFARVCQRGGRSEEHTSELQSRSDLVCRLLLDKKTYTSN